jgi:hypothetical protein
MTSNPKEQLNTHKTNNSIIIVYISIIFLFSFICILGLFNLIANKISPECSIRFNVTSPQSTRENIVMFPNTVKDNGGGIYPGARFEVSDENGRNFKIAERGCDFDSYGPTQWQGWNCTWDYNINHQPGIHTVKLTVKDSSGMFSKTCTSGFELTPDYYQ